MLRLRCAAITVWKNGVSDAWRLCLRVTSHTAAHQTAALMCWLAGASDVALRSHIGGYNTVVDRRQLVALVGLSTRPISAEFDTSHIQTRWTRVPVVRNGHTCWRHSGRSVNNGREAKRWNIFPFVGCSLWACRRNRDTLKSGRETRTASIRHSCVTNWSQRRESPAV